MSKLTDALAKLHIHNSFNLVANGHPVVSYNPGLGSMSRGWHLAIKGKSIPGPWYERGGKTFMPHPNRDEALRNALDKCREMFPEIEMVKGPWRMTYVPRTDLDAARLRLAELADEADKEAAR